MKRLIIFANVFPFGTWEPFLGPELEFVKGFDQIHIISLSVREAQHRQRRELPPGPFTVDPIAFKPRWFYAVRAPGVLLLRDFRREVIALAKKRRLNALNIINLLVFFTRARHEAAQAVRLLEGRGVSVEDEIVYYSYRTNYQPYLSKLVEERFPGRARIARSHRADLYEEFSATGLLPMREFTASYLDRLHCISDDGYAYWRRLVPSCADRLRVSRLGSFDFGQAEAAAGRDEVLHIVTCSSISHVKRLNLAIEALAKLDGRVRWDHYGEGDLAEEIRALAETTLPDSVEWHFHGFVPGTEVVRGYVDDPVHVFLNVSESEGVPVSIMEALSTGTPVLATDVGGTAELVDETCGRLVESNAGAKQIAQEIEAIRALPEAEYLELRRGARRIWERKANAEKLYPAFWAGITSMLEE